GGTAELLALLVRFEQRLLHHVGRIELAAQPPIELDARQEPQVVAEFFDQPAVRFGERFHDGVPHGGPPSLRRPSPRSGHVFASNSTTAPPGSSSRPVATSTQRRRRSRSIAGNDGTLHRKTPVSSPLSNSPSGVNSTKRGGLAHRSDPPRGLPVTTSHNRT